MKSKNRPHFTGRGFWFLCVAGGLLILSFLMIFSVQSGRASTEEMLNSSVEFIRTQATLYTQYNDASTAKSMLRATITVHQMDRNLSALTGRPQPEQLQQFAGELWLTGIILMDGDGNLICEYSDDKIDYATLWTALEQDRDAVLDVARYPKKTYLRRLDLADGSNIILAAHGRTEASASTGEVVMTYFHTDAGFVDSYTLSLQDLLSNYSASEGSVLVVVQNQEIVASTNQALIGTSTPDHPALAAINQAGKDGRLVRTRGDQGQLIYGLSGRGQNCYIYAFAPYSSVFRSTPANMSITLAAYMMAITIIQLFRRRSAHKFFEEQSEKDRLYREGLRAAAEKAEQANHAKTEFLQRMSHDIRTPINGIRGMVEIGNYYADDPEKQADCRKKIWDTSGMLLELVNEILDMGKLESGEMLMEERPFRLDNLLWDVKIIMEKQAAEHGLHLFYEQKLTHHTFIGSPLHIKRLIMNILSNAVRYNKENGEIHFSCEETDPDAGSGNATVRFVCRDTGIGMSEEFLRHIFEPFTQENTGSRSHYSGTGLGMPIAKSLADKMGGSLTVESRKWEGSTFTLTLPLRIAADADVLSQPEEATPALPLLNKRILVAEDNELNMEIAHFALESAGATVISASDGRMAVELFRNSAPGSIHAILMDVMMPEMNGHEAARQIRALPRKDAATVPILAMSANAYAEDIQASLDAGMNTHIIKPIDLNQLIRTLRLYLS